MDFQSLKDKDTVKTLFLEIWKSLSTEVSKLKDVNKENFKASFDKYFWSYLRDEYKKVMELNLNYFKFEGRASRKQYWMFLLFCFLFVAIINILGMFIPLNALFSFIILVFGFVTLLPTISLAVRRLHDIDLSGWWAVFALIPYIGWLILIPLSIKGDTKANKHGAVVK